MCASRADDFQHFVSFSYIAVKTLQNHKSMKKRFITDEENRVVACVMTTDEGWNVSGVAKCSEEDTFDLEKGKEIAYLKALRKAKKKSLSEAKERIRDLEIYKKKIQSRIDILTGMAARRSASVDRVTEEIRKAIEK